MISDVPVVVGEALRWTLSNVSPSKRWTFLGLNFLPIFLRSFPSGYSATPDGFGR
jgi:hypothetical protein